MTNYICLVVNLEMMGLDTVILVCALFHFDLVNPLVVLANMLVMFVAWDMYFLFRLESIQLVTLFH